MSYSENVVCLVDVNMNFLNKICHPVKYFNSVLSFIGMKQLITESTLESSDNSFTKSVVVVNSSFPLHEYIGCTLNCEKLKIETRFITIKDGKHFKENIFLKIF